METAKKMLENGIQDGRYADIRDVINPNMDEPFYKAIVQFAEDYAYDQLSAAVDSIEGLKALNDVPRTK
jgi:hypothetical protein